MSLGGVQKCVQFLAGGTASSYDPGGEDKYTLGEERILQVVKCEAVWSTGAHLVISPVDATARHKTQQRDRSRS